MALLRLLTISVVLAGLAIGALHSTPSALACSAGPDYNPVEDSDVIVEGRITAWEFIEGAVKYDYKAGTTPTDSPNFYGPYDAIRASMQVVRSYKGSVAGEVTMVDGNTAILQTDGSANWVGTSGACGAFDAEPTGRWFILGLSTDQWGRYRPNLLRVFYAGDEASGPRYTEAVQRLDSVRRGCRLAVGRRRRRAATDYRWTFSSQGRRLWWLRYC